MESCSINRTGCYEGYCFDNNLQVQTQYTTCYACLHNGLRYAYGCGSSCDITEYSSCPSHPPVTQPANQCSSWCDDHAGTDMTTCLTTDYMWVTQCQNYPTYGYCLSCECLQNGIPVVGKSCDDCLKAGYIWQVGYVENTTAAACPVCSCASEPAPYPSGYQCSSYCSNLAYSDYSSCLNGGAKWVINCSSGIVSCANGSCQDRYGNVIAGDCQYCLANGYIWLVESGSCGQTHNDCTTSPPPSPSGYTCQSNCSDGISVDYAACLSSQASWMTTCLQQTCTNCQCADGYENIIVGDCQYCLKNGYTWAVTKGTCGQTACNCTSSPATNPAGYFCQSSCSNIAYTDYTACINNNGSWITSCKE